ncbi:MAG: septum site-determining protein MinD [Clostridiales bacterium]|nr:septum site-determining protein MinD [Clostridiales bacterium]MCF8023503.1 septum site-determining protein MinD [Clostridiales bacterium]
MGEVIVVTSGKGGVGKTTTASNMGAGLAENGYIVCLIDADIGLRNLDVVLGLENRVVYDITNVISGKCKINQALVKDKFFKKLFLLPAAQIKDKMSVTPEEMCELCNILKEKFDFVIIDCPAGIERGFKNATAGAENAIVVTTPEVAAVRDADRIIGFVGACGLPSPRLVINRFRPKMVNAGDMMSIDDILDILSVDLLGIIPEDELIIVGANTGELVIKDGNSLSGQAYKNVVQRLKGNEVPYLELQKSNFFSKLSKVFSRQ